MLSCQACFKKFRNARALRAHYFGTPCSHIQAYSCNSLSPKESLNNRGRPKSDVNQDISNTMSTNVSESSKLDTNEFNPKPPFLLQSKKSLNEMKSLNCESNELNLHNYTIDGNEFQEVSITELLGIDPFTSSNETVHSNKQELNYPPSTIAQIDLLNLINKHNVDLKIYDEIVDWLKFHSMKSEMNWPDAKLLKREQLLGLLGKSAETSKFKPVVVDVPIPFNNSVASVPVFNFTAMVLDLFHDDMLMDENNLMDDFDIMTGKFKTNIPINNYGDYPTGTLYKECWDRLCTEEGDMLLPLRMFMDKTHADFHGVLCTSPIMYTFAFFKESCQNNPDFWRSQCYIPNITYGESTDGSSTALLKLQSLHNCIKIGMEPIRKVMENGGIKTTYKGKDVNLKPVLYMMNGDMSGKNEACAHFNTNSNIERPCMDCKCSMSDLDNDDPQCIFITEEEVRDAIEDAIINQNRKMTSISKYHINNGFEGIELFDPKAGIYGHCPSGGLHLFGGGIYQYIFQVMHDMIGQNKSKKEEKKVVNKLFQIVAIKMNRQSERDFPRRLVRNSPMDGTKLGSTETRGNLFCFLLCMHITKGRQVLKPLFEQVRGVSYNGVIDSVKLILSFEKWCNDDNPKEDVEKAGTLISAMKRMIKKFAKRQSVRKRQWMGNS